MSLAKTHPCGGRQHYNRPEVSYQAEMDSRLVFRCQVLGCGVTFTRASKRKSIREMFYWTLQSIEMAEKLCLKIELLRDSIVFHSQCDYLVQIISKGIQEVKETYFLISEDEDLLWRLYVSKKLSQLANSLASLLRDLMSAERLLQACGGTKWKRAAIVLSMPPFELEKYTGSIFFLLIRDFNWSLDLVRHSLHLGDASRSPISTEQTFTKEEFVRSLFRPQSGEEWDFKWCHRRCRYKLQRNVPTSERKVEAHEDDDQPGDQQASEGEYEVSVATKARSREDDVDERASGCKDVTGLAIDREESLEGDFDRQAQDRKNLPGIVEKNWTAREHGSSFFPFVGEIKLEHVISE